MTDVCLKRKIRNYVALTKGYAPPHDIYVKDRGILANEQRRAYKALGIEATDRPNMDARKWMCQNFYDVRTFGAVMTTGKSEADEKPEDSRSGKSAKKIQKLWNCGQVRGPVQIGFSKSQSPINTLEHTITRTALTNPGDAGAGASDDDKAASGQMGRKYTVPYGLYRAHGFISPFLAQDTGFAQADSTCCLSRSPRSSKWTVQPQGERWLCEAFGVRTRFGSRKRAGTQALPSWSGSKARKRLGYSPITPSRRRRKATSRPAFRSAALSESDVL